jgi:hypothetical protein
MSFDPQYTQRANTDYQRLVAGELFRYQAWKARLHCIWAAVTHKPGHLQELHRVQQPGHRGEGAYMGMRTVAIDAICGSEQRAADFDSLFRPLRYHHRDRWVGIAEARLRGEHLPPVQLIELGGRYFVRDGHHRISVAQALGEAFVDAEVVRWQMR